MTIPAASDRSRPETNLTRLFPGGRMGGSDEMAVAGVMVGSALALYGLRRGLTGVGQLQLTGSAVRGVEFAAYLLLVGGVIRTLQTQFPESRIARAVNYIY